MTLIMTIVD